MTENFDEIFNLMVSSFPKTEYRSYEQQKELLENPLYEVFTIRDDFGRLIAFVAFWNFNSFIFVEHLAVSELCRGKGMGSIMMRKIINNFSKPVILEIEVPCDEISNKRLRFYEKLGFKVNEYEYYQLPLNSGDAAEKMLLLSYPEKLYAQEFEKVKNQIYKEVYKNS